MNTLKINEKLYFPIFTQIPSGENIIIRSLQNTDNQLFSNYFTSLSSATTTRFQPHPLDQNTAEQICQNDDENYYRLIAYSPIKNQLIAYFLILWGVLPNDQKRYQSLSIQLNPTIDCTFAPSVADDYQSQKLGNALMPWVIKICQTNDYQRIILWGGVQSTNTKAVKFYQKFGFQAVGSFQNKNGDNWDMYLDIKN